MRIPSTTFRPSSDYARALKRAAELWGIDPGYWDVWGTWHEASPGVVKAILESLGVAAESTESLDRAVQERLWSEWSSVVPPVQVVSENAGQPAAAVRVPAELASSVLTADVDWEDGRTTTSAFDLRAIKTLATAELRGQRFVEKRLPFPGAPLGYHVLHISGQDKCQGSMRFIVAPDKAYMPDSLAAGERRAGLNISLYGIHSGRSWGCGDFTDLERLAAWVAGKPGGAFITLNPLHSIHNRQPYNTSPYLPNSIFYKNLIYLDVEKAAGFARSQWARRLTGDPRVQDGIRALNRSELVEYERVHGLKKGILKLAFRAFMRDAAGSAEGESFREFVEAEGELLDRYAVYCAVDEWLHKRDPNLWTWPQWPQEYQDPESEATRRFAQEHRRSVLFHKYVQWQIETQLEVAHERARELGLSIGLFHDLALATDNCGSDLWAHRRLYVGGCRVGAPPDAFSPKGQDWAFPPPNAMEHFRDGYRHLQQALERCCRHGGALRIDHVMRFFRLFWIPSGESPSEGTYVRDRHEDLIRILALESVRNRVLVVGEDLGTVEPLIREVLANFGILGYRVFYFEKDDNGGYKKPDQFSVNSLVTSSTHDLPTLAGFWAGRDIHARHAAGIFPDSSAFERALEERREEKQKVLDILFELHLVPENYPKQADKLPELTGELHYAIIGFLMSTPGLLLALNEEDLTKETEQQNLPGTTHQYPNWRRKMRYSLEDLETSPEVGDFVRMFRNWLDATGRKDRRLRA